MWRSLVAHLHGVQGVAGSNPVIPTIFSNSQHDKIFMKKLKGATLLLVPQ
jgi:hypothetical protein